MRWLLAQLGLAALMLAMSLWAGALYRQAKLEQERRHWSLEQSVHLVGALLALVIILGGFR